MEALHTERGKLHACLFEASLYVCCVVREVGVRSVVAVPPLERVDHCTTQISKMKKQIMIKHSCPQNIAGSPKVLLLHTNAFAVHLCYEGRKGFNAGLGEMETGLRTFS